MSAATVPAPDTSTASAVKADSIRKSFGATVAVDDVSFDIAPGTVHALLGENGAGKSTIVKLLSGLIEPDSGGFTVFGEQARLGSPRASHRLGIETAFQEMTLVKDLTVLDNMLLPYAPVGPIGMIRRRMAARDVAAHFERFDIAGIDLEDEVRDLDLAVQQKIEIARAIYRKPRILLLDEPTSTLSGRDVDWLGDVIARLKGEGVTIVFISHRMPEVRAFCDRLTVLRNGGHIATGDVSGFSDGDVIEMIIGRSISQTFPSRPDAGADQGPEVLAAAQLCAGRKLKDASFSLRRGEILGVGGLQGMGQLDLFLACFGMAEIHSGTISVDGKPVTFTSPADAIGANIGLGMVPEDRKTEALFLKLNGKHNASLPVIERFTRFGLIDGEAERTAISRVFDRIDVDRRALWTPVGAFSGGNQQKIAIAKWLVSESRILLLFDPTRGIDVGTKHELYVLMREYVEAGGSILFFSTEIPELVNLADRVMVLYGGRVAEEIPAERLSEQAIVKAALGGESKMAERVA
ncbi:sugar ABC transporter ATP-binding protein [Microbaculum marinum]|uniref:Sugar ABC transporter ATP-binding protein n=1 Tax=Microbaculum marinum TaxID=1764581 RepID=A0AAW9RIL3_9HYPH